MRLRAIGLEVPLVIALLATSLAVEAQQETKVSRTGILRIGSPPDPYGEAFRQGLRELEMC